MVSSHAGYFFKKSHMLNFIALVQKSFFQKKLSCCILNRGGLRVMYVAKLKKKKIQRVI